MKKIEMKKRNIHPAADVLLICMPFGFLNTPSIGMTLLKEILASSGISTKLLYFTIRFAKKIGPHPYIQLFNQSTPRTLLGDWIFSKALFNRCKADERKYIDEILCAGSGHGNPMEPNQKQLIHHVLKASREVESFLDESLLEVLSYHPRIVGFTNVFFQQSASLSLASRIKSHSPKTFIVFGGPNCEGVMGVELIRQFPFVDAVVSGEGEIIFPKIVQAILNGEKPSGLQGVYTQLTLPKNNNGNILNAPSLSNLDDLPFIHYDDYYEQLKESGIKLPLKPINLFETSRGCWWGEKKKCVFCGLNGENHFFRFKSGQRAIEELAWISKKYPGIPIQMVDNVLNMHYFENLIPDLARRNLGLKIFYETRPNLKKEQIRALKKAGIENIQPGIESLSTPILKLMRKGVNALQNIQLLKWCKEFDLYPYWNLLYGFPLEPPEEYERMKNRIPLLTHLRPPGWISDLWLYRFSPYFENPEQYGLMEISPSPVYQYIYPFGPNVLSRLAYFFTCHCHSWQNIEDYVSPVLKEISSWVKFHESSELFYVDDGRRILIWDQRPISSEYLTEWTGLQRTLYLVCDSMRNITHLQRTVSKVSGREFSREEIRQILQPLIDKNLMIREGHSYLSLAIPLGAYSPHKGALDRFQKHLNKLEELSSQELLMENVRLKDFSGEDKINDEELKKSLSPQPNQKGGGFKRGYFNKEREQWSFK